MCQCSEEGLVRYSDFKESVNKEFKKLTNSTTNLKLLKFMCAF